MARARKFYNPRTYPIHVDDGRPVAPGEEFSGDPEAEWLQLLLTAGDALPVSAERTEGDQEQAAAGVAAATGERAKVQARASTRDNEVVPPAAASEGVSS